MTSSNGKYDVELTITLAEAPGATDHEFVLLGSGGEVSEGSTLPDARAALAAVEQFGEEIFFPVPRPDRICTQQYGGPQVAVVTGRFRGRDVNSRFSRTDGCEIARWRTMAALLGGISGSTGNT
ncbi:serine protease inhibitor [Arthrobacter sp. AZCC_0090]|uniref:serine protease inhibitor n=1 Tax=Arthrobacter sp. AZCC_0090 TaxID=2735881 RepID=UPI001620D1F8|nr:serine protease inhibitor [Arthrobacter sp. AZCC_0090]MBB6406637.1 aminoglycoside phosphotransferase (APT) family kinase protein [Arthrobacter sp. AZCC_0090]